MKFSPTLSEKINALSQAGGFTPYMILLAAFQTLLHRYTGQEDIVVGSPVAGRGRACLEKVVGLFVNMLVLRTKLDGNPAFYELLHRTQATVLEALAHQDLPFEKLVEELQPERSASHRITRTAATVSVVLSTAPSATVPNSSSAIGTAPVSRTRTPLSGVNPS